MIDPLLSNRSLPSNSMQPTRTAILAAFVLLATSFGSASAAHCRSETLLVLDEAAGIAGPGSFDPLRPAWEADVDGTGIAWGISCQEGTGSSERSLSGTSIVADQSIATVPESPPRGPWFASVRFFSSVCSTAPEPRPPRPAQAVFVSWFGI